MAFYADWSGMKAFEELFIPRKKTKKWRNVALQDLNIPIFRGRCFMVI